MKRTWSTKTTTCTECSDVIEWTTVKPRWCKPCYRKRKTLQQAGYNGKRNRVNSTREKDPMPAPDWLMEAQFSSFYDLIGLRYKDIKDVSKVIGKENYAARVIPELKGAL